MRLLWVFNFIICASLVTGSGELLAAKNPHKSAKGSKSIRSVPHKNKLAKGPRDIWERIRSGMQIPRPTPVSSELASLVSVETTQNPKAPTTNLKETTISTETAPPTSLASTILPQSNDCEPALVSKLHLHKSYPLIKTRSQFAGKPESRVHAQFNVKPKSSKLNMPQMPENIEPTDDIEKSTKLAQDIASEDVAEELIPTNSIDAEMQAFQTRVEKIDPSPKQQLQFKTPCIKNSIQQLMTTTDSAAPIDVEAIRQQMIRYDRVKEFILRYTQAPGFLASVTERSRPYIYHIVESLSTAKMPMELALLPIVESAYQPKAESPKSAAGLWQFIPSTGVDFHLKQTAQYDDRLDIIQSTNAAIHYLGFLRQHYKGDWLLALAAYNCGQGAVDAAITVNQSSSLATDFWSLQLPEETKDYVPRLLALATIFANPGNYKVQFAKIKNEPYFARVDVTREVDIKHLIDKDFSAIAQLADLSPDQFSLLNPGYLSGTLSSTHPSTFLIPVTKVKELNRRLRMLTQMALEYQKAIPDYSIVKSSMDQTTQPNQSIAFLALDIKDPETKPTQVAKPLDHSLSLIATFLAKDSAKNPTNQKFISFNLEQTKASNLQQDNSKASQKQTQTIAQKLPVTPPKSNTTRHALRTGETLKYLAQRYQVTEDAIRSMNKFSRHQTIQAGQHILIPAKKIRIATNDKKELLNSSKRQIN